MPTRRLLLINSKLSLTLDTTIHPGKGGRRGIASTSSRPFDFIQYGRTLGFAPQLRLIRVSTNQEFSGNLGVWKNHWNVRKLHKTRHQSGKLSFSASERQWKKSVTRHMCRWSSLQTCPNFPSIHHLVALIGQIENRKAKLTYEAPTTTRFRDVTNTISHNPIFST